jgi:hypothetical protein
METDLHALELGHGEPIVFVHGSFDTAEETFPEQRQLADQYRVVLVDRRGYGESPPAVRFDFDSQVDDLIAVLDRGASGRPLLWRGSLPAGRSPAPRPGVVAHGDRTACVLGRPGDPSVERFIERLQAWYATAGDKPKERLVPDFLRSFGLDFAPRHPTQ